VGVTSPEGVGSSVFEEKSGHEEIFEGFESEPEGEEFSSSVTSSCVPAHPARADRSISIASSAHSHLIFLL
jgi:hypothetical protein